MSLKRINPQHLVPLDVLQSVYPITIDLVYSKPNHSENTFGKVYHDSALMWAHKNLAKSILLGAKRLNESKGWVTRICDALRPVEAQAITQQNASVHPLLLSAPGKGGHPRGLAIDIAPQDAAGNQIDMGTPFDFFAPDPEKDNPAARDYKHLSEKVLQNRADFEEIFVQAARDLKLPFWPLSQEWWDFRYPLDEVLKYAPLHESDLHPAQRMLTPDLGEVEKIRNGHFYPWLKDSIDEVVQTVEEASRS